MFTEAMKDILGKVASCKSLSTPELKQCLEKSDGYYRQKSSDQGPANVFYLGDLCFGKGMAKTFFFASPSY